MFKGCSNFNQPLTTIINDHTQSKTSWNIKNVEEMFEFLMDAHSFNNGNISGQSDVLYWDTKSLQKANGLFKNAYSFNRDISRNYVKLSIYHDPLVPDYTSFNLGSVNDLSEMFSGATSFNQNIGNWNVGPSAENMSSMFSGAAKFNQNIGNWNVENVNDFSALFNGATSFNQNIGGWNVSSATDMSSMFKEATSFNQNISSWNVSDVSNFSFMFSGASSFNQNIGGWNVSSATDMSSMFKEAASFNQNISSWNGM